MRPFGMLLDLATSVAFLMPVLINRYLWLQHHQLSQAEWFRLKKTHLLEVKAPVKIPDAAGGKSNCWARDHTVPQQLGISARSQAALCWPVPVSLAYRMV